YDSNEPNYISLNKDFVSTRNWINHYPLKQYNSYIFGNSRSMYYQVDTWKDLIHTPYQKCYHFDASGESIYGIEKKFQFLASNNAPIKNALIVIDAELLNQASNSAGHIFIKDPIISGQNEIVFQLECLKAFFDFKFLTAYLDFKVSGKVKDYMKKDFLLDEKTFYYDNVTNELRQEEYEAIIEKNADSFYFARRGIFYIRDTTQEEVAQQVIRQEQIKLLANIKKILTDNLTNFKIIISPLYNQKKLNSEDLKILNSMFGSNNVHDFSGINEYTNSIYNYYETSHYRPQVAKKLMEIVYDDE
ncbi:hypothetical protein ACX0G7_07005, partial [Flavitalea antarctica]